MGRGDSAMGQHHGGGGPIGTALWGSTMGQGDQWATGTAPWGSAMGHRNINGVWRQRYGAEGPIGTALWGRGTL